MDKLVTVVVPMAKTETINIRTTAEIKAAISEAAKDRGFDMGPWLLRLAAQAEPKVAEAMGLKVIDPAYLNELYRKGDQ